MSAIQQLLCSLRGGHQWETTEDAYGGTTVCSRCGKLHHRPGGGGEPPDPGMVAGGGAGNVGPQGGN